MDTVFKMSSMTEESLKSFIKDFGKNGLAKVPNENVCLITFQVDGVAERLADSSLFAFRVPYTVCGRIYLLLCAKVQDGFCE